MSRAQCCGQCCEIIKGIYVCRVCKKPFSFKEVKNGNKN